MLKTSINSVICMTEFKLKAAKAREEERRQKEEERRQKKELGKVALKALLDAGQGRF